MSKFMRTNTSTQQKAATSTSRSAVAAEMDSLGHPRKLPVAAKTPIVESDSAAALPSTEVASDRPIITLQKKGSIEPPTLSDITKKMRKDSGAYNFIPLSSGKYMDNIWWEPIGVDVTESRRVNGCPWMLLTVRIFIDIAGLTPDIFAREMENKFRCDHTEVLKIAYLRERFLRSFAGDPIQSYDDWYRDMVGLCNLSEAESDAHFAKTVFDRSAVLPGIEVPETMHVFFCKKPHTDIMDMDSVCLEQNYNSLLCKAVGGKSEFKYEFRVRLFYISTERRKIRHDTVDMLTEAESQNPGLDPVM